MLVVMLDQLLQLHQIHREIGLILIDSAKSGRTLLATGSNASVSESGSENDVLSGTRAASTSVSTPGLPGVVIP